MDEGEVGGFALGAYERVVGDVGEVALNGSFVRKYHKRIDLELCAEAL